MRYYYRYKNNYLSLKSPISDPEYTEITEEEFRAATEVTLTPEQEAEIAKQNRINELEDLLRGLDYIGVKIATGRGTREEYAEQIALMQQYADEINELRGE